jgi:hypothetical protein
LTVPSKLASSQLLTLGRFKEQSDALLRSEETQAFIEATRANVTVDVKAASFKQAAAPTSPVGSYVLRTADQWVSTDTSTNCPDLNCTGRARNANGTYVVALGSAAPHAVLNWTHLWNGSAWRDAERQVVASEIIASNIAAGAIVADKITAGEIIATKLSVGQSNLANLWPNPNSESDPPSSYAPPGDGTDAEYDFRLSDVSAFSGGWVRRLQRTSAGSQLLKIIVPATINEVYTLAARCKWVSTGGTPSFILGIDFLDKDLAALGGGNLAVPTSQTSYGPNTYTGIAPSGTVYVRAVFSLSTGAAGTAEVRFDAINFLRRIDGSTGIVDGSVVEANLHDNAVTQLKIAASSIVQAHMTAQETWTTPTFTNSWVNFGSGNLNAGYMKDHLGIVHLRGKVSSGTMGLTAFTLPVGYRPSSVAHFACASAGAFGEIGINSSGNVIPTVGSNVWFDLTGITFDTN